MKRLMLMCLLIYFSVASITFGTGKANFTAEELKWIEDNPVVLYAPDPGYAPYEFFQNGRLKGMVPDYLDLLSEYSGLEFEIVALDSWGTVVEQAKEGTIDVVFATKTKGRSEFLIFTEPVINYPNIIISNDTFDEKITEDNVANYSIGYMKDYAVEEYITLLYSDANTIGYATIEDGLRDVSLGKIDVFMGDMGQVSHYTSELNITNLKVQSETDYHYGLRFGVTNDQKLLRSILEKSLSSIDGKRREEIRHKWIILESKGMITKNQLYLIYLLIAVILIVGSIVLNWNRVLRQQVAKKTKDLNELNKALEQKVSIRTQSLAEANGELEASMDDLLETQEKLIEAQRYAMLGELIVGVAHELNTPIGNGLTSATYMKEKTHNLTMRILKNNLSFKDVTEYADMALQSNQMIISNLDRATKIIDRFKALESSQWSRKKEMIDLDKTLQSIIERAPTLDARLGSYDFTYVGNSIMLETSVAWIYELLEGLMMNTLLHGYKGLEKGKVIIKLMEDEDYIIIIYEDRGVGISKEEQEKVFSPFYTTSTDSNHIGLGLPIIYNLITRELGGSLVLESELNEFTRFRITLPK